MAKKNNLILPIQGMTCANCVSTVERNVKKLEGIESVVVNLSSERAAVSYEEQKVDLDRIIEKIQRAGYDVAIAEGDFILKNSPDALDSERISKSLQKIDGIRDVKFNFASNKVTVSYIPTIVSQLEIRAQLKKIGFEALILGDEAVDQEELIRRKEINHQKRLLTIGLIFTIPLFFLSMGRDFGIIPSSLGTQVWFDWLLLALATPVQFYVGAQYYVSAYKALRNGSANMDVLIALGSSVAYFYSILILLGVLSGHVYLETAAVIITLIRLGKYLEARAKGKTGDAIRKLLNLQPDKARIKRGNEVVEVKADEVVVGDVLIVRPGDKIPVDGVVLNGKSQVDESMITGESKPIAKEIGDSVIGSTQNRNGMLEVEATKVGKETTLSQIVKLVESAQGSKAPIQGLADKISSVFVPIVLIISLVTFLAWNFLGSPGGHGEMSVLSRALINAVSVLVIACPCAMGLATPTAMMVGTGKSANSGILFRTAEALERSQKVDTVVLDKTGTITRGHPEVTTVEVLDNSIKEQDFIQLAASLESASEHPLGEAIVAEAGNNGLDLLEVINFRSIPGKGVSGEVNGKKILAGNLKMMQENGVVVPDKASEIISKLQNNAETPILIAVEQVFAGVIGIADQIKEGSRAAIESIKASGRSVIMLTGDNEHTARAIARLSGIENVIAEVLPGEKAEKIKALQEQGAVVAMVGDGVNDAPALAQSDLGIALGTGSDVAVASAPVTLLGGDLSSVMKSFTLSKMTFKTIKQNLFWAFFYNILLIPVAAMGLLNPMLAAGAMAFSSVFVVTNSLRLANKKISS
jgi:P-type Cu+ transporter